MATDLPPFTFTTARNRNSKTAPRMDSLSYDARSLDSSPAEAYRSDVGGVNAPRECGS